MQTLISLHKNYTLNGEGYQLKLPLNLETIIPVDDSVRLLGQFVEAMDLTDLYSTYKRINTFSPRTLLKIVLYSYMNGDYSSRSMELNCKRDINFMYLLEGKPVCDHATFARFRSIHFAPCAKRIPAEMSHLLYDLGEISGETIFIDGTKIEACANRYTFVWKKAVTRNQGKMLIKIAGLIAECEQLYGIRIVHGDTVKMKHVKRLRKKLYALKQEENIAFVHGIGKRKSALQKSIETLEGYLGRLSRNGKKLSFAYVRWSKSKTGYASKKSIYQCSECKGCPYKKDYIKGNNCKTPMEERNKVLSVAKTFLKYRKKDLERIVSEEGILLCTNRSIQAEGSFGELKQDMQFRRYLSRGTANVLAESVLLAMAGNVNKLHNKIQKGRIGVLKCVLFYFRTTFLIE